MRLFYEIEPAYSQEDLSPLSVLTVRDILCLFLGRVYLTHSAEGISESQLEDAKHFIGQIEDCFPGHLHICDFNSDPNIVMTSEFTVMKSLFEFILSAIDAGHLTPLEPKNDSRFFKLKRVATQENFPSLKEDGFIKTFISFVQILQFRFQKEQLIAWIVSAGIINWLKDEGCKIPEGLEKSLKSWEKKEETKQNSRKKAPPSPTKDLAKTQALKGEARKIFNRLSKKSKPFTYKDIMNHPPPQRQRIETARQYTGPRSPWKFPAARISTSQSFRGFIPRVPHLFESGFG